MNGGGAADTAVPVARRTARLSPLYRVGKKSAEYQKIVIDADDLLGRSPVNVDRHFARHNGPPEGLPSRHLTGILGAPFALLTGITGRISLVHWGDRALTQVFESQPHAVTR